MILNLKRSNKDMLYIHFKTETINSILILATPNCYMPKVSIKDACYSIPILPEVSTMSETLSIYMLSKWHLPSGRITGPWPLNSTFPER